MDSSALRHHVRPWPPLRAELRATTDRQMSPIRYDCDALHGSPRELRGRRGRLGLRGCRGLPEVFNVFRAHVFVFGTLQRHTASIRQEGKQDGGPRQSGAGQAGRDIGRGGGRAGEQDEGSLHPRGEHGRRIWRGSGGEGVRSQSGSR